MDYDISEGKFFAKWPAWIRWVLFFPSATLGCVIVSMVFNLITSLLTDSSSSAINHGWYNLISSVILGAAFVGIAAYLAPKKQFEISIIMLIIFSVVTGMLWVREYDLGYFLQTKDLLYQTMHLIAGIVGACIMLFVIKEETQKVQSTI